MQYLSPLAESHLSAHDSTGLDLMQHVKLLSIFPASDTMSAAVKRTLGPWQMPAKLEDKPVLKLTNSLTRSKDVFVPENGNKVRTKAMLSFVMRLFRSRGIFAVQQSTTLLTWVTLAPTSPLIL